VAGQEGLEPTT